MTSEWRPKVGERVAIYGTVTEAECNSAMVAIDDGILKDQCFTIEEMHPLPAAAEPRAPWEVLHDAAEIAADNSLEMTGEALRDLAKRLEAAAAPKPPTLAEAVRAYLKAADDGPFSDFEPARSAMVAALARAEAEAGR
jgi:hypothetical protein